VARILISVSNKRTDLYRGSDKLVAVIRSKCHGHLPSSSGITLSSVNRSIKLVNDEFYSGILTVREYLYQMTKLALSLPSTPIEGEP